MKCLTPRGEGAKEEKQSCGGEYPEGKERILPLFFSSGESEAGPTQLVRPSIFLLLECDRLGMGRSHVVPSPTCNL
jgi:hypothetical protein